MLIKGWMDKKGMKKRKIYRRAIVLEGKEYG